jgi:diguanylate cyclase (GGDEF)-like protein
VHEKAQPLARCFHAAQIVSDSIFAPNKSRPRRWLYGVVGALLALGAPLGLLTIRFVLSANGFGIASLANELASDALTYAYVTISTLVVFSSFGAVLGAKEDRTLEASWTDPLTGVSNRRYLNLRLEDELARATRYDTSLGFLLLDVDHLKQINDQGGHHVGDRALISVADALVACSRQTDTIARFGGDEFAWLAPYAKLRDATELGERVRWHLEQSGSGVTVSVGVADLSSVEETSPRAIYEAADQALYEAKRSGRDRVVESRRAPPGSEDGEEGTY